jgi:hypothetical protein
MAYYPKNQIQTNLTTPGSEYYIAESGKNYIGLYWKRADGKVFSGATPTDPTSTELLKYQSPSSEDNSAYSINFFASNPLAPTPDNYKYNNFERYFIRRVNQPLFIEIDSKLYSKFEEQSSDVPYTIYILFKMPWLIKGDREHVYRSNRNIVLLREQNYQVYGLQEYLQEDYLKYYK